MRYHAYESADVFTSFLFLCRLGTRFPYARSRYSSALNLTSNRIVNHHMDKNLSKQIIIVIVVIVLGVIGYGLLTMPDHRTTTERIGDAIHDLPQGADKASRQLEDRTPRQKLGDAIKDTGDKVKDNTSDQ
jgi:hypothetical protein